MDLSLRKIQLFQFISMRLVVLIVALLAISGCRIQIKTPAEGFVQSAAGELICPANDTCTIDVSDFSFDVDFVAVPHDGYAFTGWRKQHKRLCGGSLESCHLATAGIEGDPDLEAVLFSDTRFFLEPTFAPIKVAGQGDFELTVSVPDEAILGVEHSIDVTAKNVSGKPLQIPLFSASVHVDDGGRYNRIDDSWEIVGIEGVFSGCRYVHDMQSILFASRGNSFYCYFSPVVAPGETLEYTMKITPRYLAHYYIIFGLGEGFHNTLVVTPPLVDSDSDGAIDVEEELSGSDPYDAGSIPVNSEIDVLFVYTPGFASHYASQSARNSFFNGFIEYANQVFEQSGVRITLDIAAIVASGAVDNSGNPYSNYISDAQNRRRGFEVLAEYEQTTNFDRVAILGIPDTPTWERGLAQGIPSGSSVGYFSSTDDYQVMLHELGHTLGANHDYPNLNVTAPEHLRPRLGTYNFSYGYVEGTAGSIMSYAPDATAFFSNPHKTNCGLSLCGVDGQLPETAANNALTLNLRRIDASSDDRTMDSDYDGLPEWWEDKYRLYNSYERCADPDGDGYANIEEYLARTHPRNAQSTPAESVGEFCSAPMDREETYEMTRGGILTMDLLTYDEQGYHISVKPANPPRGGRVRWDIYGMGHYRYQPNPGFTGVDSFDFDINNGIGGSAKLSVRVEVVDNQ